MLITANLLTAFMPVPNVQYDLLARQDRPQAIGCGRRCWSRNGADTAISAKTTPNRGAPLHSIQIAQLDFPVAAIARRLPVNTIRLFTNERDESACTLDAGVQALRTAQPIETRSLSVGWSRSSQVGLLCKSLWHLTVQERVSQLTLLSSTKHHDQLLRIAEIHVSYEQHVSQNFVPDSMLFQDSITTS